jgi:hypothetical protein
MSDLPYDVSRDDPAMSQAADRVSMLISQHPEGVTLPELMKAHKDQVTAEEAVIAAILLLLHEGKIYSNEPWTGLGFIDHVRLFSRG